jgi:7-cyano-7-deazaguanine synthase
MRVVAIVSGGLDSTTLAYHLAAEDHELAVLSFNYGQRHGPRELPCAEQAIADLRARHRVDVPHHIVDLRAVTQLLSASSLTNPDQAVPEGHYAEGTMRATVVPNRNLIMLSVATGYAVSIGAEAVATAVHAGDHFIYPDCRPEFIAAAERAFQVGNEGFVHEGFRVVTPFLHSTKADIARLAGELGVPIGQTWSCYMGGDVHCGRCGTCVERIGSLVEAGVDDPTEYTDRDFWRQAEEEYAAGVRR